MATATAMPRSRLTLADGMMLVAALAGSLALARNLNAEGPIGGVRQHPLVALASGLSLWLPTLAAPWPFALTALAWIRGERSPARSGLVASWIGTAVLALGLLLAGAIATRTPPAVFHQIYILETAGAVIGGLVAGAWFGLTCAGKPPAPTTPIDLAGCVLGVVWIVAWLASPFRTLAFLFGVI